MKFRYKKYAPGILRPVIPVEITHKNRSIPYEVLVDSGADFCILDAQIGELLGIDIESGTAMKVAGITGVAKAYYIHAVKMSVGGWVYSVKVGFLSDIAELGYGVVGQKGFFDIFIVKFDLLKEEVELKPRR